MARWQNGEADPGAFAKLLSALSHGGSHLLSAAEAPPLTKRQSYSQGRLSLASGTQRRITQHGNTCVLVLRVSVAVPERVVQLSRKVNIYFRWDSNYRQYGVQTIVVESNGQGREEKEKMEKKKSQTSSHPSRWIPNQGHLFFLFLFTLCSCRTQSPHLPSIRLSHRKCQPNRDTSHFFLLGLSFPHTSLSLFVPVCASSRATDPVPRPKK